MAPAAPYPKLPIYPNGKVDQVKERVHEMRVKSLIREEDRLVESHIHTLLGNRRRNIRSPESEEKMGVIVMGESGSGKSQMIRKRTAAIDDLKATSAGTSLPFATARLRAPVKLHGVGFAAAVAVGYEAEVMRATHDYWHDFRRRIQELDTQAIHFDEVQDAFINTNVNTSNNLVQMFKGLMTFDKHPLVLILTGTLDLKPYFETKDQQGPRRFYHVTLPALSYPSDAKRIKANVDQYCREFGLKNNLVGTDYDRLLRASDRQFGRTFARTLDAIEEALLAGSNSLELVHFAHAYERDRNVPPDRNFFLVEDYGRLSAYSTGDLEPGEKPKRQSKHRSKTAW